MEHFATTRYILAVLGLVLLLGSGNVYAQPESPSALDALAPRLRAVVTDSASPSSRHPLLPLSGESRSTGARRYDVFIHVENEEAVAQTNLPVHVVAPGLATARLTARQLRTVSQLDGIQSVGPSRTHKPLNDGVRARTGAHSLQVGRLGRPYSGKGVLACVIDTGIDWRHPDFRRQADTTQSRIRSLWDQTLRPQPSERSPSRFNYGVEYKRGAIEDALARSSDQYVRSTDDHGHGTAVSSTLAGNGAATAARTHRGMAPQADLVAVKTDFSGVGIADGLRYCGKTADEADRPVVVSLGVGTLAGPHDGSSPLAQTIDAFTGPGRSVVVAAGNHGDENRHVVRSVSANSMDSLQVRVPRYSPTEGPTNDIAFHLDVWASESRLGSVSLVTPTGQRISMESDSAASVGTTDGTVAYERSIASQGDEHIELIVSDASKDASSASGTWNIVTANSSSRSASVHGWLVKTSTQSTLPDGNRRSTITTPATARSAISVGAQIHRTRWHNSAGTDVSHQGERSGAVAPFSSRGPLRNDSRKPDVIAPGQWVASARSRSASIPSRQTVADGPYGMFQGTSIAAGATAGAIALLFQEDPSLSAERISRLISGTAHSGSDREDRWTPTSGHGSLDIFRAMANLLNAPVATRSVLAYDDPASTDEQTEHTIGEGERDALSIRITPERSGTLDGLFVRTAPGTSNELRDSLTVAVYTDDDGRPGRQVGTRARIAPDAIQNHTLNFISASATNAVVRKGVDYHVVVRASPDGGTLSVLGEQASVDERSLIRRSGTWRPAPADLGVRVVTSFSLDLATPSPTGPEPRATIEAPDVPTLSWETVSEANRYTIHVSTTPRFRPAETDTFRTRSSSISLSDLPASTGYYWRVRADRLEYTGAWSNVRSFLHYPDAVEVSAKRTFASRGDTSAYRLVALPGQQSTSIQRTVSGQPGSDWQAYWDRGRAEDGLVSFDGSSTFQFRPGTGFWLRSTDPWIVQDSADSVPLAEDGTYEIPLHEGWNVISNPFDLDVSWRAVKRANKDRVAPLWRFSDHFEQTSTFASAQSGEAFYFLNDQNRDALRIPYPAHPNAPSGRTSSKKTSQAFVLSATQETGPSARIYVGTRKDAKKGLDRHDQLAPPRRFTPLSMHINPSDGEKMSKKHSLVADYRSPDENGYTFPLTLQTTQNDPVTIRVDSAGAFPEQRVVLLDPATGNSYDLRTASPVTIRPQDETRSLRLLIGSSEYVETKKNVELPGKLQFLPNYPNPFSEQTTLEYVLPSTASVRLTVYDVLGRQVRVLVDKKQQAGRHTVQWTGRDESGQRMASGVYLARLMVDGTTKVRKLTFVR